MTQDMEGEEGGGITEESTQWAVDADGSVEEDVSMEGRIVEVHHVPVNFSGGINEPTAYYTAVCKRGLACLTA